MSMSSLAFSLGFSSELKEYTMKKTILGIAVIASLAITQTANAQVRVNVNVNIGSQPQWGPAGYDYVEYYYLPDIETYYYVPNHQFIYMNNGVWIYSNNLPPRYRSYNLYSGYKVVINQPRAYNYFTTHKVKYKGYKGNRGQVTIKAKGNNGNHYGQGKNKGRGH
jgi:hypothetical protein